jgi:hypothetical protein
MAYTLSQAARACGRGKTTLLRAVRSGRISAIRDDAAGTWLIEESELHRVFPSVPIGPVLGTGDGAPRTGERNDRTAELEARITEMQVAQRLRDEAIEDLRRRLDEERAERRQTADRLAAAQERITALLTDQRAAPPAAPVAPQPTPRQRWWPLRQR